MFSRLWATLLFVGLIVVPASAWAHDASKHKGKATRGKVVSVSGDRMELKTATGTKTVTLTDQTKFEHGNQTMAREDLKKGDQVKVIGTTLASGEIVAREVLMAGSEAQPTHTDSHAAYPKGSEDKH
jgi:Domain of unknown function (DUF5666)